jgi:hypothetical protein
MGLPYPLFVRLELRYTVPGAPFEVTALHPDTCNHFHGARHGPVGHHAPGSSTAGDAGGPGGGGGGSAPAAPVRVPDSSPSPAPYVRVPLSRHCHKVPVTDSVFSGMLDVAANIKSTCALPMTALSPSAAAVEGSAGASEGSAGASTAGAASSGGGGGGGGDGAPSVAGAAAGGGGTGSTGQPRVSPPTFSSIYLRRDKARGDVTSGADVSLSERLVLRVVCVTLPNLKHQAGGGIQRVPAVVPYRWAGAGRAGCVAQVRVPPPPTHTHT